jgi:hypothetical protein
MFPTLKAVEKFTIGAAGDKTWAIHLVRTV